MLLTQLSWQCLINFIAFWFKVVQLTSQIETVSLEKASEEENKRTTQVALESLQTQADQTVRQAINFFNFWVYSEWWSIYDLKVISHILVTYLCTVAFIQVQELNNELTTLKTEHETLENQRKSVEEELCSVKLAMEEKVTL